MQNIVDYFNTFLDIIFDGSFNLVSPDVLLSTLIRTSSWKTSIWDCIVFFISNPHLIFSFFVWSWFAVLTINLLLIFPYKWIRSVIRKCSGR